MLTRMTRMAHMLTHMLTRMTRWLTGSHIIHTHFLSPICTSATCWKELYTLASNCPRVFSCPS